MENESSKLNDFIDNILAAINITIVWWEDDIPHLFGNICMKFQFN